MAKAILKIGYLKVALATYGVTELTTSITQNLVQVTDTTSPYTALSNTGFNEFMPDPRLTYSFSATVWKNINSANITIGLGQNVEISFDGFKYSGTAYFSSLEDTGQVGNAIQQKLSGSFTGTVTVSAA